VRPANNTTQDNISISLKANAVQDAANNNNTSTSLGNGGRSDGAVLLAVDTQEVAPIIALHAATGLSSSDAITNDAALTVTVDSQVLALSTYLQAHSKQAGAIPLIQWRQMGGNAASAAWHDVAITATQMTLPGVLAEGSHSYEVRVIDALGNISGSSTGSYTLDTVAPASPRVSIFTGEIIASGDNWSLGSGVITLRSGVETDGKWAITKDGGPVTLLSSTTGTTYTLADGNHTYHLWGTDLAGNTTATISFPAYVDAALLASMVPSLMGEDGALTSTRAMVVTRIGSFWSYSVDGGAWTTGTGSSFNLQEGTHSYRVRSNNAQGEQIVLSLVKTFTLDTTPPAIPVLQLVADNGINSSDFITNNANLRVSNYESGAILEWRQKTTPPTTTWNLASGSSFDLSNLGSGSYTVEVRETDAVGNSATGPASDFTFTYVAPHPTLNLNGQTSTLSYTGAAAVTLYPSILNDNYTFS
ncbi:MAG: Ig-like domain-containing protein, partial [Rhodoferax sp.]|nr:Ig-like domain-containing protein [Rhodoferax sp.]